MRKIILPFFIFGFQFSFGQNPLVKMWDNDYGGLLHDVFISMQQTTDGGYILGGQTKSDISGNKTQPLWGAFGTDYDYWIVKTDSLGNKQWDKDFGGTDFDYLMTVRQTKDGGYIVGGYSISPISGDKTQPRWSYAWDYWIVKTDSLGIKQWDKVFGSHGYDFFCSVEQTSDGGYILGGYTNEGNNGDNTQSNWGADDYWIVKTDSLGIKQWDKGFGGTSYDHLRFIHQTTDGGYILGGNSSSGISGDKTQSNWGVTDYWIVKIDSLGIKQWDKDFGGTLGEVLFSIEQTADGGYILGGYSKSDMSGDKTQPLWGIPGTDWDYWIVKIDTLGNKQWDKDFGGTDLDELFNVSQTTDGGYLLSGDSYSPISGDKTENNFGVEQTWIIKTDSLGTKQWDKTILTSGHDENALAIQTNDGCYAIANATDGIIGGYKSQTGWGGYDYWLVKFCEALVPLFTSPSSLCPGTCIDFVNLSSNATSYQWYFPGANPDTSTVVNPQSICYANSGSYDVQLVATNANGSDTLLLSDYITVYPTPSPQSITQNGDTLFAIAGAASYQWYFNGTLINGATEYFYVAPQSGNYNVVATDANGCEVEAVINNVIAEIQLSFASSQLAVFPNPANDRITIHNLPSGENTIEIVNLLGEIVYKDLATNDFKEIDLADLTAGVYIIKVSCDKSEQRIRLVKN